MKQSELKMLRLGDIIAIVSDWDNVNHDHVAPSGEMDKWLGAHLTVDYVSPMGDFITVLEDDGDGPEGQCGHWHWYADMIERRMPEEEYEIASRDDITRFLLGGGVTG